jgi:hypothetical protein
MKIRLVGFAVLASIGVLAYTALAGFEPAADNAVLERGPDKVSADEERPRF